MQQQNGKIVQQLMKKINFFQLQNGVKIWVKRQVSSAIVNPIHIMITTLKILKLSLLEYDLI